jgi:hypothetical protein
MSEKLHRVTHSLYMTILNKIGYSACGLSWKHTLNQHAPNKLISKNHVNIPSCDYCSHSQAQLLDPWWMSTMVHVITQGKVYPYAFTRSYLIVSISEGRLFVCLFVTCVYVSQTMAPLVVFLVLLKNPPWIGLHQVGFINVFIYGWEIIEYRTMFILKFDFNQYWNL